ncbi:hypothetical protein BGZ89_011351 [Linnemannia elongata]|nr:hypothetical protein BGZ89_011351 [Linnemannia elongata]
MSYVRVNDASDSEDEASSSNSPSAAIHSPPPPPRTRQAGSVAAATLAAMTRGGNSNRQGYSRLGEDDDEGEVSPMQEPVGAGVVDRRQEDEQSHEQPGQSRRQSQDQMLQRSRTEENADLEINVRFGEGQDLSLRVPRTDTIAQVKDKIKEARSSIENKYLRLIHSGKILVDNKTLIESLPKSLFTQVEVPHQHHQSRLSSSVEAVEAAANNILAGIASRTSGEKPNDGKKGQGCGNLYRKQEQQQYQRKTEERWIKSDVQDSCIASEDDEDETRDGAEEDEEEEEEELSHVMTPQATGFDRLREAGFSEDEIRSIRRQFHASRGTVTSTVGENGIAVGLDQDEDANARARRIEEEWIDQHGAETLPEGLEGSYGEMVWGLMLGFFMGLIVLFWFKEATFSRRQQMGIIAGMMINVGFGVLHLYY